MKIVEQNGFTNTGKAMIDETIALFFGGKSMKNKLVKKVLVTVLACAIVVTSIPTTSSADERPAQITKLTEETLETVEEETQPEGTQPIASEEDALDAGEQADAVQVQSMTATQASEKVVDFHGDEAKSGTEILKELEENDIVVAGGTYRYSTDNGATWRDFEKNGSYSISSFENSSVSFERGMWYKNIMTGKQTWKKFATLPTAVLKKYYTVTVTSTGTTGGIQVNGSDAASPVKRYASDDLTFTVMPVNGYFVSGVTVDSVAVTAVNDVYTIRAAEYAKDVTVCVNYVKDEGISLRKGTSVGGEGSIDFSVNGMSVADRVSLNTDYTITVTPNTGYAVEQIRVTSQVPGSTENTVAYGANKLTYDAATHAASLKLNSGNVDEAKVTISAVYSEPKVVLKQNAEVSYHKGLTTAQIRNNILAAVFDSENSVPADMNPEDLIVEYNAGNYTTSWQALDYQPGKYSFGKHTFGKETEAIRITWNGTAKDPFASATATITLKDLRLATTVEVPETLKMKFQDQAMMDAVIKALVANHAVVRDAASGAVIPTTADSFETVSYKREAGDQEITITYKGDETYASSTTTADLTIVKGDAKVKVTSKNVTYGTALQFDQIFAADPAEAGVLGIFVGIDGNGKGRVSFAASEDDTIYHTALGLVGSLFENGEASLKDLTDKLNNDTILLSLKAGLVLAGMTPENATALVDSLKQGIELIQNLVPGMQDLRISFGKLPTEAGIYTAVGITTNANYNTAYGVGMVTISPATADVHLRFYNELPTSKVFTVREASKFQFGGEIENAGGANVKAIYAGITSDGELITSKTPITETPGVYTETLTVVGGNHFALPIIRKYTVIRSTTSIRFEQDSVTTVYDGAPHALTAHVYDEEDQEMADVSITYTYVCRELNYNSTEAPTEAGTYAVVASYVGDDLNMGSANTSGTLVIQPREVTLIVADNQSVYGQPIPEYNVHFEMASEVLGDVSLNDFPNAVIAPEAGTANLAAGSYPITVTGLESNTNYKVTVKAGTLVVAKRPVSVEINAVKKTEGTDDPELTYTASTTIVGAEAVAPGDELGLALTREAGEEVGLYDIYLDSQNLNENYVLTNEPDGTDKFEIVKKEVVKPEDPTTPSTPSNPPKQDNAAATGDTFVMPFYFAVASIALAALLVLGIWKRKER